MFEFVLEDTFDWYPFRAGRTDISERCYHPERITKLFMKMFPERTQEELRKKEPTTYQRTVFFHRELQLYFIFMEAYGVFVNVGFIPDYLSLNETSFLPQFDLGLDQYADDTARVQAKDIFLSKMEELIPTYQQRNDNIRPLGNPYRELQRESLMRYKLLQGEITIPGNLQIKTINGTRLLTCSMRNYLPGKVQRLDYCFYQVSELKNAECWLLD